MTRSGPSRAGQETAPARRFSLAGAGIALAVLLTAFALFAPVLDTEMAHRRFMAALADHEAGRHEAALEGYRALVGRLPCVGFLHERTGALLYETDCDEEARDEFNLAACADPLDPFVRFSAAANTMKMGMTEETRASYDIAITLRPDFKEALLNRGLLLFKEGSLEAAVRDFRAASEAAPGFVDAHYNLGNGLFRLGRTDEAVAAYGNALSVRPDHVEARFNRAVVLVELGRGAEAAREFSELSRRHPGHPEALLWRREGRRLARPAPEAEREAGR